MDRTVMTIIGGLVATVLVMLTMATIADRNEEISQLATQTITSEFADKIATSGIIKENDYDAYVQKLAATGNTYEIDIEVQHLDENPGKKAATTSPDMLGENVRYSTFASSILSSSSYKSGGYPLKKGDIVIVTVKNTNITIAQTFRNFFYSVTGNGTYQIGASASSMVVNNGKVQ